MKNKLRSVPDVSKATTYAIIVNTIQIVAILLFVFYALNTREHDNRRLTMVVVICAVIASWGAIIDIQEALRTRHRERTINELQTTNHQMDQLNLRLREQRHDFLNHIQVVYSLLEMEEYREATAYLERIYDETRTVSRVLRTKMTAFNALLQVKSAACEERGIVLEMDIRSTLDGVPVPPWEMCCIIGNLLDNAMDAAGGHSPRIALRVTEDLRGFTFVLENNGDPIPPHLRGDLIFEPGVSTKGDGHGMGLSIVRKTLAGFGGVIRLDASDERTAFIITIPRENRSAAAQ